MKVDFEEAIASVKIAAVRVLISAFDLALAIIAFGEALRFGRRTAEAGARSDDVLA